MKIYLYNEEGLFLEETQAIEGITYPNSTDIAPDFLKDREIYNYRFDKFARVWSYEYKLDYVNQKAKELGLEFYQVSLMSESEIRSAKLPDLPKMK